MLPAHGDPADLEAIAQLRALLRGDHGLIDAEEAHVIAAFLAGEANMVQGRGVVTAPARIERPSLGALLLRRGIVPAEVVIVNFLVDLLTLSNASLSSGSGYGQRVTVLTNGVLFIAFLVMLGVPALVGAHSGQAARQVRAAALVGLGSTLVIGMLQAGTLATPGGVASHLLLGVLILCAILLVHGLLRAFWPSGRTAPKALSAHSQEDLAIFGGKGDVTPLSGARTKM